LALRRRAFFAVAWSAVLAFAIDTRCPEASFLPSSPSLGNFCQIIIARREGPCHSKLLSKHVESPGISFPQKLDASGFVTCLYGQVREDECDIIGKEKRRRDNLARKSQLCSRATALAKQRHKLP
jgi:hypothetical protein